MLSSPSQIDANNEEKLDEFQSWEDEDGDENKVCNCETLIDQVDPSDIAIRFAPAENNKPIAILFDQHAEELSFPTIYCGEARNITCSGLKYTNATSKLKQKNTSHIY